MNLLRAFGAVLCAFVMVASAQVPQDGRVELKVEDFAKAFIPEARVSIDRGSPHQQFLKADSKGILNFGLPAGRHEIRVYAQGFSEQLFVVDMLPGEFRALLPRLQVGMGGGVSVWREPDIQPESLDELIDMEYEPLESFSLPPRKLKSHHFWR